MQSGTSISLSGDFPFFFLFPVIQDSALVKIPERLSQNSITPAQKRIPMTGIDSLNIPLT